MRKPKSKYLILGIGNDILGDDGVGLAAARLLKKEFEHSADIVEAIAGGFKLMELLEGYDKVLILDAVITGQHPVGTVLELSKEEFQSTVAIAPHYMSLPEAINFAEKLGINFPKEIRILAVEIEDPYQIREGLSSIIEQTLPNFVKKARGILAEWGIHTNLTCNS